MNQGFEILNSDATSGLITASLRQLEGECPNYVYLSLWAVSSTDPSARECAVASQQNVTILVDKINENTVEVKIQSHKRRHTEEYNGQVREREMTWSEGVSNKAIFDALSFELNRRKTTTP
jgi:hypothetical protein